MGKHKILIMATALLLLFCSISRSIEESSRPSTQSPDLIENLLDILRLNISSDEIRTNCQFSTTKGRRPYQEDRLLCDLELKLPFHGKFVKLGLIAVFDGHIGEEASDMASKVFLPKFLVNTMSTNHPNHGFHFTNWIDPDNPNFDTMDERNYMDILKEALVRTIKDVDVEFSEVAVEKDVAAGTTAVVALLVDDHVLVANVGDSKALLCSVNAEKEGVEQELTRDHTALIREERSRVEAAGAYIFDWKVPLIMGHFPMTRAIGDVPLKKYGIIAEPEVTEWKALSGNDSLLVVASDGIFESLSPKDVCNLLHGDKYGGDKSSMAEFIVQMAFEKGSTDNLSVIVVPLS